MDVSRIKSELSQHLTQLGRTIFECPSPRGNHDPALHAYMIDTQCASHFKKQREDSLRKALLACDASLIDNAVTAAVETKTKQSIQLLHDTIYGFNLDIKAPGSSVNTTSLRSRLERDGKYTSDEIDELFEACKTPRAPAKMFTVNA